MKPEEIVKYLEACGAEKISIKSDEIISCCPIHHETRPSFGVALDKAGNVFNCFSCHASGYLPKIAMSVFGKSWKEAFQFVNKFGEYSLEDAFFNVVDSRVYDTRFGEAAIGLDPMHFELFDPLNLRCLSYLKKRGIKRSTAIKSGMKRFEGRLMIPWYDGRVLVGFTSRSYRDAIDRYRGLPLFEFKKHQYLYNPNGSEEQIKVPRVHLVEGETDALRMRSLGYESRGLSGTKFTKAQINALCACTDQVVLVMDNDYEGESVTEKLIAELAHRVVVLKPTILDGEYSDPCALTKSLARQMFAESNLEVCF